MALPAGLKVGDKWWVCFVGDADERVYKVRTSDITAATVEIEALQGLVLAPPRRYTLTGLLWIEFAP